MAIARLEESVNTETIRRVDGDRTITLSVIPPRDIPLEAGVEKVTEEILKGMKALRWNCLPISAWRSVVQVIN